jgi:hypothetical protein
VGEETAEEAFIADAVNTVARKPGKQPGEPSSRSLIEDSDRRLVIPELGQLVRSGIASG